MQQIKLKSLYKDADTHIGHPYYFKRETAEYCSYYIFILLRAGENQLYITKGYLFNVPFNGTHAFMYELGNLPIPINYIKNLYVLTNEEFTNTYYTFFKYDKYPVNELPAKLIQDV